MLYKKVINLTSGAKALRKIKNNETRCSSMGYFDNRIIRRFQGDGIHKRYAGSGFRGRDHFATHKSKKV